MNKCIKIGNYKKISYLESSSSMKIRAQFIDRKVKITDICLSTVTLSQLKNAIKEELGFPDNLGVELTFIKYDHKNILKHDNSSLETNGITKNNMLLYVMPVRIKTAAAVEI